MKEIALWERVLAVYALKSVSPPPWFLPTQTSAGKNPGPEVDSRGGDWISLSITEVTSVLTRSEQSGDTCSWGRATGGSPTHRVHVGSRCFRPALHLSAASFLSDPLALSSACSSFPEPSCHPQSQLLPLPLLRTFAPFLWMFPAVAEIRQTSGHGGSQHRWPCQLGQVGLEFSGEP